MLISLLPLDWKLQNKAVQSGNFTECRERESRAMSCTGRLEQPFVSSQIPTVEKIRNYFKIILNQDTVSCVLYLLINSAPKALNAFKVALNT